MKRFEGVWGFFSREWVIGPGMWKLSSEILRLDTALATGSLFHLCWRWQPGAQASYQLRNAAVLKRSHPTTSETACCASRKVVGPHSWVGILGACRFLTFSCITGVKSKNYCNSFTLVAKNSDTFENPSERNICVEGANFGANWICSPVYFPTFFITLKCTRIIFIFIEENFPCVELNIVSNFFV